MDRQARVVIIGGGIMGCSLLYHLAKEGWTDCMLVEKAELTSGSTWHAAGQISHSTSHWGLANMVKYGTELYPRLEEETGQSATWHGCGSLRLAYNTDEMDWLKYTLSVARGLGLELDIIGTDEIAGLHPFYNLDGVLGALHTPNDGHVDPAGAAMALAKGARQMGASVVRHNRVTGIKKLDSGEWKVITEQGDIMAEIVVNAGGTYARQIGAWVGLDMPITNMTHHYLVTDTVPEFLDLEKELPVVRDDREVSGYIRMEQKSGLIGIYEKADPNTVWDNGTPWESENELFEADFDRIMPWLENAFERMPILAELGIKKTIHGAITHPPDGNMLLGPAPGLENFWCCCGSQVGIAWGPGAGKYLAQWMVHGAADINMRDFDPRRYGDFANRDYQITKAREDYILRHEIPFPGFNRTEGRPVKTSTLYDRLKAAGAVYEEIFGWERPRWFATGGIEQQDCHSFQRADHFTAVAAECKAVRERVGIMDLSGFGKIDVTGPDAERFLNRIIANRAPRTEGGIVLSHILNHKGTIEAEITVARIADNHYYLMFAAFSELRVRDWLNANRGDDDVSVTVVSKDYGCLVLSGPRSRDVLTQTTQASLDNNNWKWLKAKTITVAGVDNVRALRMSYQGELGWELHVPMDGLLAVYDALWAAGEMHDIANFGSYALNSMRLEKGFEGASELTTEVTLPEAGVMNFVKMDKGDFIGRDKTQESLDKPLPWICVYLEVDAEGADCVGSETVYLNGERVGQVSSGGYGHGVQKSLAHAFVNPKAAEPGTVLEIHILNVMRKARVLSAPVYDPDNEKPRS
jgi:dimethylglycine dehydrogenase